MKALWYKQEIETKENQTKLLSPPSQKNPQHTEVTNTEVINFSSIEDIPLNEKYDLLKQWPICMWVKQLETIHKKKLI